MRILDLDSDKKLDNLMIFLTKGELQQLIGYANQLLQNPNSDHHHLSSEDYQKEITICIYEPENSNNFNPRMQKLLRDDT